jgi:hypothetical protein
MQGISSFSFSGYYLVVFFFYHVQFLFLFFHYTFKKHLLSTLRSYGVKASEHEQHGKQAYGVWKSPPHMPVTITGA